jgi:hypothetical protein
VCGLLFIGVFFTYTMNYTDRRGETDDTSEVHVEPRTGIIAPGGLDIAKAEEEQKKEADEEKKHSAGENKLENKGETTPTPAEHH